MRGRHGNASARAGVPGKKKSWLGAIKTIEFSALSLALLPQRD
jgi:hypothetical protein